MPELDLDAMQAHRAKLAHLVHQNEAALDVHARVYQVRPQDTLPRIIAALRWALQLADERIAAGTAGLDLDAIEARANAATPGPWMVVGGDGFEVYAPWDEDARKHGEFDQHIASCDAHERSHPNAVFIAAARTDVLALVAALRAAQSTAPPAAAPAPPVGEG